jgi:CheY-like chemotaxis protein
MQREWLARVKYRRRTLVAKILVADDNSNIQKMVSLALKDQGIDVVAVGNGEAAVRKISDVRPDLVLADVFMPVRNGYEVCQFVKTDSTLSHIPVILLVGAFDPLDEQEAQRVGADGVLKKPFIPPDPLISMVKSALQRSGAGHANAPTAKGAEPEALRAAELFAPVTAGVPTVGATPVKEFQVSGNAAAMNESFVEEVPARPEPLKIDSAAQPVAFGSLLETPAEEKTDDESFVAPASPEFAMEHDWRDQDDEETEEEAEDEEPAAWRPAGSEEEIAAAKSKKSKSSITDWRTGGFEQIGKARSMGWEPEEEKPEPVAPAIAAPPAVHRAVETPVAPAASISVKETPAASVAPPAPTRETPVIPSKLFGTEQRTPPVPAAPTASNEKPSTETATAVEEKTPSVTEAKPAAEKKDGKDAWFSVSPNPWDAEIQKASQMASTWDTPATKEPVAPKNGTEKAAESVSQETKAVIEEAALPPMAIEAIREEAAQVAEDATLILNEEPSSEGTGFYASEQEASETPAAPTAATPNMDDVVAKVLAKMSPEMLQAVTREILKPVVEAMVKEELKSKKP